MNTPAPNYLLFSKPNRSQPGGWSFALQSVDGADDGLEAADVDPDARGERLELLTVVLGLEALNQPSSVTVVSPSRYVRDGIANGLTEWRENQWLWECHGQMVPVKNCDLWQRLDRALKFHQVRCRHWRIDQPHYPTMRQGGCFAAPHARPTAQLTGSEMSWANCLRQAWTRWRNRLSSSMELDGSGLQVA